MKKVFIGSDHAGYKMKERIKQELSDEFELVDMGPNSEDSVDYPVYAEKVANEVAGNSESMGVLLCGNGVGITMAANKVNGVRAALAYSKESAMQTRQHNNANVVATAGRSNVMDDPVDIVRTFLETEFSGEERHARRVEQIMDIEKRNH